MTSRYFLAGGLALCMVSTLGLAAQKGSTPPIKPAANGAIRKQPRSDGERVFQQNCWRCHTAPEGFPPRISGTIVRHMRVRASLSQHDEQELLKFLNP